MKALLSQAAGGPETLVLADRPVSGPLTRAMCAPIGDGAAAALVCSEKSNSVKIKLTSNLLEITAQSPDFGEAHESMAISYSGPELQVAFNPAFVMDPLRALTKDEVYFELKDEVSPGVFKTLDSFICVIMPVRLS